MPRFPPPPSMLGSFFLTVPSLSNTLSSPLCRHRPHFLSRHREKWVPLLASHDTSAASLGAQITTVVTKTRSFQVKELSLSRQAPGVTRHRAWNVRSLRKRMLSVQKEETHRKADPGSGLGERHSEREVTQRVGDRGRPPCHLLRVVES